MGQLDFACDRCGAPAGSKCRNYSGKGKASCPTRGNVHAQAGHTMHAASAAQKNAKARARMGPLFAAQAPQTTAEAEYWRWRRVSVRDDWLTGETGLMRVRLSAVRLTARRMLGAGAFERLDAKCRGTYPSEIYWLGFWRRALTGARIELRLERVEDRRPGEPAVRCVEWHERAVMTPEEFDLRFPGKTPPLPLTPAEVETAAYLDGLLARLNRRAAS